jgi:hypothetical protein
MTWIAPVVQNSILQKRCTAIPHYLSATQERQNFHSYKKYRIFIMGLSAGRQIA